MNMGQRKNCPYVQIRARWQSLWDIDVLVVSPDGDLLVNEKLKEERVIKGNVWVGAKYAFEKQVPLIYLEIVKDAIRNNELVKQALLL